MPKSRLTGSKLNSGEAYSTSEFPVLRYELMIDNMRVQVELSRLLHFKCDITQGKANRQPHIIKYAHAFKKEIDCGSATATVYNNFLKFKSYLMWCDDKEFSPFCEATWKQYRAYLWELVLAGSSNIPIWQQPDGQMKGIKERTANYVVSTVEQALVWCEVNVNKWGRQLRPFKNGKPESYEAYSDKELSTILNRVSSYFFQLALPLLNDEQPSRIDVEILGQSFGVTFNSENKKGRAQYASMDTSTPFNQAMSCAYYLLSYFTAFNSSQLIELRHPIDWQQDKTNEYFKLSAHKRRANREVISFIGGEIHKKSIQFIETLIALSLKYNNAPNGLLVYWLDKENKPRGLSSALLNKANISSRLMLISDKASTCLPYLFKLHRSFITTSQKGYVEFYEHKIIGRKLTRIKKVINRFYSRRVTTLSILLLYAIIYAHSKNRKTTVNLKGAVLPLTIKQNKEELQVTIHYEDNTKTVVYIDTKYHQFLENIQAFASLRQKEGLKKYRYLLPLGPANQPMKWEGLIPNTNYLNDYGIAAGEFFVSLLSSRFRETAAKLARRKANRTELHVSQILNNQYRTVIKHYTEGNHYDNQLILAQGLSVIEVMSKGQTIQQAKSIVASESNMDVIKFDEIHFNNATMNGVGVACSGNEKLKQDDSDSSVCFDYENCIKCKFAKLVDDIEPLYRLLSFLECMEESWLYYPERFTKNIGQSIELYRRVITENLPKKTIEAAQLKLDSVGRHVLWDNLELASMGYKGV